MTKKSWVGKAVKVDWIDSMKSSGWHDYKSANMHCTTIGHYHSESDDRIVIAQNRCFEDGMFGDYMEIPKCSVKRVKRLKE
jgi:hypothetical protein